MQNRSLNTEIAQHTVVSKLYNNASMACFMYDSGGFCQMT